MQFREIKSGKTRWALPEIPTATPAHAPALPKHRHLILITSLAKRDSPNAFFAHVIFVFQISSCLRSLSHWMMHSRERTDRKIECLWEKIFSQTATNGWNLPIFNSESIMIFFKAKKKQLKRSSLRIFFVYL